MALDVTIIIQLYLPVGQQQHCSSFAVVVLVVRGNIGVGPVAGEMRAVGVQIGTHLEWVGKDSERGEGLQTSFPESAHLNDY